MKKIISALILVVMLATCLIAAFPASAKTTTLDWSSFSYEARDEFGKTMNLTDLKKNVTFTADSTTLKANRTKSGGDSSSYISTTKYDITSDTSYTYEIMVKSNTKNRYGGVPFAIDSTGKVYFIYGSFDNNNDTSDSQSGKSYLVPALGDFDGKILGGKKDTDAIFFKTLKLDNGFASLKFEYDGLNVKIMAKDSNGNYVQVGNTVTLSNGSKTAFGVFSRISKDGENRTVTIKNGKFTVNEGDNGADDLKTAISKAEAEHPEANYTADSYAALKTALTNAKTVANNEKSTKEQVDAAKTALETAISGLKAKSVDKSKLEALITKAEALKEKEWSPIGYTMLMKAVKSAKELLKQSDLKQTDIDNTVATIQTRMDSLVAADGVVTETEEAPTVGEETDNNTVIESGTANESESASGDMGEISPKEGCGSAVAATAVVLSIVAGLGTALVVKKKD